MGNRAICQAQEDHTPCWSCKNFAGWGYHGVALVKCSNRLDSTYGAGCRWWEREPGCDDEPPKWVPVGIYPPNSVINYRLLWAKVEDDQVVVALGRIAARPECRPRQAAVAEQPQTKAE